jgi:hypothetical protein
MHEEVLSRRLLAHNKADLRILGKSSCCLVASVIAHLSH